MSNTATLLEQNVDGHIAGIADIHAAYEAAEAHPEMFANPDDAETYGYDPKVVRRWIEEYGADEDEIREHVMEYPLSAEVREGWKTFGGETDLAEFRILLGFGGPNIWITGNIGSENLATIEGYWGSERLFRSATDSVSWFAEFFNFDEWQ